MKRWNSLLSLVCSLSLVAACVTSEVPPVGRTGALPLTADERRNWKQAGEERFALDRSGRVYENAEVTGYVNRIAARVVPAEAQGKGLSLQIKILKNPLLNAFAYPDGVVYMHTGILARMDNEAQLAALFAHEMTHVTHRHTVQQYQKFKNSADFLATLQVVGAPFGIFGGLVGLLGTVGAMASVSGYSRELETEADREGLERMAAAGYDPREALKLFSHLKSDVDEQKVPEPFFFGSHPRLQERIDNYSTLLKTKYANRTGTKGSEDLPLRMLPLILENAQLDLHMGRFDSAWKGLEKVLRYDPTNARAHFCQGELYHQRNRSSDGDKAMRSYGLAVQCDPGFAEPHKALGLIYFKSGRRHQARLEFERYLLLAPEASDKKYIEQYLREP